MPTEKYWGKQSHKAKLQHTSTKLIYLDLVASGSSVQSSQGSYWARAHHNHLLPGWNDHHHAPGGATRAKLKDESTRKMSLFASRAEQRHRIVIQSLCLIYQAFYNSFWFSVNWVSECLRFIAFIFLHSTFISGIIMAASATRKCTGLDCPNHAGTLQCPTCLKMGTDSFFCSQDCFKRSWVRPLV